MAGSFQGFLRKTIPLCGYQDPICPNSIYLDAEKTTTFGRTASSETNVRLLSSKTPLMISRKHASVACINGIWTILDHNSLNGIFVNGRQIPSNSPHEIKSGDRICFGVAFENNVHEFDYTFEVVPGSRKRKIDSCELVDKDLKVRKVLRESVENKIEAGPSGEHLVSRRENIHNDKMIACKIQQSEKKIENLKVLLAEKEKAYQNQIEQKEKDLADQLLQQKDDLEREKNEQEEHLLDLLEGRLREKEKELADQLEQQKTILLAEKEMVENNLRLELDRKLEEKDKELTTQLEAQRDHLENVVHMKVNEQQKLQVELNQNKIERKKLLSLQENEKKLEKSLEMLRAELTEKQDILAKQQDVTRKAEEMAKKALVQQMEDEFTCIICQELFIQATTLTCSHSFCDYCLKSWLKKKMSCPICRAGINGTFVRSVVLDSAIEKIVETMDDETKQRRENISQERKKLSKEIIILDSPPFNQNTFGNQGNPIILSPTSTRDNDVQIVERPSLVTHIRHPQIVLPAPPVIMLPQAQRAPQVQPPPRVQTAPQLQPTTQAQPALPGPRAQPGLPGVAQRQRRSQGNHGNRNNHMHCYVCGMRGHWARACPFR